MRKFALLALCILLIGSCLLTGCGQPKTPAEVVKKELTSAPWLVDMSEGTTASYTFTKDGHFTCDAAVSVGEESAAFSRSGDYAVAEIEGKVVVILMYPHNGYEVELTVQETESGYKYWIAGCPMYQE